MDAIAKLVAIEEIKQLKGRYFRFVDTQDWEAMTQVFCRDAVWDCSEGTRVTPKGGAPVGPVGPVIEGREAVMAWISESFRDAVSVHRGSCHEVTIDSPTEAHGVIAMEDIILSPDRRTRVLEGSGHYHEQYRFEDGAWRIARTRLTRLLIEFDQQFIDSVT